MDEKELYHAMCNVLWGVVNPNGQDDCATIAAAELVRLRAQLAASESKRALLATECKAWRAVDDTCKDEQFSVLNDRMQDAFDARAATDAACALENPR